MIGRIFVFYPETEIIDSVLSHLIAQVVYHIRAFTVHITLGRVIALSNENNFFF